MLILLPIHFFPKRISHTTLSNFQSYLCNSYSSLEKASLNLILPCITTSITDMKTEPLSYP